jgi:hypothetical protein
MQPPRKPIFLENGVLESVSNRKGDPHGRFPGSGSQSGRLPGDDIFGVSVLPDLADMFADFCDSVRHMTETFASPTVVIAV